MSSSTDNPPVVPKALVGSFILVTTLFALWGFANDITNPLVAAFKSVFDNLTHAQSSLIQFAFYGGYATMAIPAALFIRKFSVASMYGARAPVPVEGCVKYRLHEIAIGLMVRPLALSLEPAAIAL